MLFAASVWFVEALPGVYAGGPFQDERPVQLFLLPSVIALALSSRTVRGAVGGAKRRPRLDRLFPALIGSVALLVALEILRSVIEVGPEGPLLRPTLSVETILLSLVLAPLLEEYLFRFFLVGVLEGQHRSRVFVAASLSSLFALVHVSPFVSDLGHVLEWGSAILLVSVMLFWLRFLTGRYWVCVAFHSMANLIVILV